eukprot:CAMPEP_0184968630 /NCGR_PEP_ID=MMETSP1098-20130426/1625_1 /TAXON_ID=89044 /ORGANISM="Spumella elongata, Strain CCAP 955/1" /LENGTH=145 /DNA_ID=CAMNT_0027490273 /DNA_START=167 /DNA_END=604 /DNA_ORIENTATION=-
MQLIGVAASTSTAGGPVLPGVATPLEHLDGAVKVGLRITRGPSTAARIPVEAIHLPESDVPLVGPTLGVLVDGVGVSTRLVTHDALAVSLVPAAILSAPRGDVEVVSVCSTRAFITATWAVASAVGAGDGSVVSSSADKCSKGAD